MGSNEKRRCPQCWKIKAWPRSFIGARGAPVRMCVRCRKTYGNWAGKTPAEKLAAKRKGVPDASAYLARLFVKSGNRKLGGIPSSITARGSCPPSCSFYGAGCYAEYHVLAHHWRRVGDAGERWAAFVESVAALPPGQLWRHNVAGDLPGHGDGIDRIALGQLVVANLGRRGFTFTHKPTRGISTRATLNRRAISTAVRRGFVVNLSADSLQDADELAELAIAPVAVVLPADAPLSIRTPAGRRVVVCPAQTDAALTCATCELCAIPGRKAIVGFRAHGQASAHVSNLVQLRRKPAA